ncbi:MAG: hypothetical protein H7259_04180 [Cytophagales bacterium]|nr:hypothetical protein [Cytophaga sp.]
MKRNTAMMNHLTNSTNVSKELAQVAQETSQNNTQVKTGEKEKGAMLIHNAYNPIILSCMMDF